MSAEPLKFTVVGDGATGKTCILVSFVENKFPEDYVPTVFDNYTTDIKLDGKDYPIQLWDTAGQEDYAEVRPLSYESTHVFIIVYSVDNRDSFENITKWKEELNQHQPNTPIVLVGNKIDMRNDSNKDEFVSEEEGKKMKGEIGATAYIECSAKEQINLAEIFNECIRAQAKPSKGGESSGSEEKGGCCVLM
mmetsp:Transcript_7750/g.11506  ORF Transcript_7750/g.11506 Transcript_7750/m.11506 type:complete len:192 (+) Transcript_7750:56-631(+)